MSKSDHGPYTMRYLRYYNGELKNDPGKDCCEMSVLSKTHGLKLIDDWNRMGAYKPELGTWSYEALSVEWKK